MKNFPALLLIILHFSCQGQNGRVRNPALSQVETGGLVLDVASAKKVNVDFNGYNTENTFNSCDIDDASYKNLVSVLHPAVLRFPGGSIGNFYHMNGKGYGLKEGEDKLSDGGVAKYVEHMVEKNNKVSGDKNYIEDFIKLASATHSDVLVVANVVSGTPEEMVELVNMFQSHKIRVRGIELGNELYLKAYKDIFPTSDEYIRKVMSFVQAARQNFRAIPLGVPVDLRGIGKDNAENNWNGPLSRQNFYDAAVIHIYADEPECNDGDLAAQFNCSSDQLQDFTDRNLPNKLSACASEFQGKRIWITEWNLRKPGNKLGGTLLQSLFVAQFMLKVNHWNSNNDKIDMMIFHNLSSPETGYGMINPSGNNYVVNPSYYTMRMFSVAAGNNWSYAYQQKASVTAGVFFENSGTHAEAYILNMGNSALPYAAFKIAEKGKAATVRAVAWEQLDGDALYAASVKGGYEGKGGSASHNLRMSKLQAGAPTGFAPYSLTRIRFDVHE